jgi:hypothetical protein
MPARAMRHADPCHAPAQRPAGRPRGDAVAQCHAMPARAAARAQVRYFGAWFESSQLFIQLEW